MVSAMVIQVVNITRVCELLFTENENTFEASDSFNEFKNWLEIEVIVFIGGVAANSFFLFVRGFVKDKIDLSVANMQLDHKSDYLEGRLILMSIVITFLTPVFYLTFIRLKDYEIEHGMSTDPTN